MSDPATAHKDLKDGLAAIVYEAQEILNVVDLLPADTCYAYIPFSLDLSDQLNTLHKQVKAYTSRISVS